MRSNSFIRLPGDHKRWNVYRKSAVICDVTEMFVRRYLTYSARTAEQMRQAARSCKQNLVEGISDKTVSIEMCIKLLGVALGSLRELSEDYGDYLRQNKLATWALQDPRTVQTRAYCRRDNSSEDFTTKCEERSSETVANIMLVQCSQLDTMIGALIKKIETEFIRDGGLKEHMSDVRRNWRKENLGY